MNFEMKGAGASFSLPTGGGTDELADIAGIIQQTTRCPICLMKYTNPKRLPCDHSFCRNCLQGEVDRQKQNKGTLSCVVCQEPINLPAKNGVDQLDGVLIIHDITRFYDTTPQPKVQCGKCNGSYCSSCVNLVCNRCDKYISTEFCTDCFEGFCSRCSEEHERTTGDHILVDVDQAHEMIKDASDDEADISKKQTTSHSTFDEQLEQNGAKPITAGIERQEQLAEDPAEDSDDSSLLNFTYDVSGANGGMGNSSELPLISSEDGGLDDLVSPATERDSDNESELDCVYEISGSNQRLNSGELSAEGGNSADEGDGGIQFISHFRNRSSRLSLDDDGPVEEDDLESSDDEFNITRRRSLPGDETSTGTTSNPLFALSGNTIQSTSNDDSSSQDSSQSEVIVAYDTSQGLPDFGGGDKVSPIQHPLRDHSIPDTTEGSFNAHETSGSLGRQSDHTHTLDPKDQQERERRVLIVESREGVAITNPTHRLSSHQYDELQQVVNATYSGEMSPEEEERLCPSAPQSDKRRRVARIRPDMTYEPKIPKEDYYKLKGLKWCSRITIGFVLVTTLSALALAGLAVTSYLLSSEDSTVHTFQDYTVLINRPRPFWTRSLSVDTSGAYDNSYFYETVFYLLDCSELTTRPLVYTANTTGTQPASTDDLTVEITTGPNNTYAYLTAGSKVNFSVVVWSEYTYTRCVSEFNLYNDYDDFIADEGVNAIYTNCIEIQRSPHDEPTSFTYTVDKESFYFATLSVPREDSYAVNISVHGQTYNTVDVNATTDEECTVSSTLDSAVDQCKFDLIQSPVTWNIDEQCLIAETKPSVPTSSSEAPFIRFTVSYNPNIFRNFAYIVIVVPVPLYLIMCLLIWLCFKGCNIVYVKCRNMHYRHEYQVTEI